MVGKWLSSASRLKESLMQSILPLGQWAKLLPPGRGMRRLQSVVGLKAIVNFEDAGKRVILVDVAPLEPVEESPAEIS
jgi:hypothetical protein